VSEANRGDVTKPMRQFIVKAFCSFLSQVQVEQESMLDNLRPSNFEETKDEQCARTLTRLENLVGCMEEGGFSFNDEMQVRLKNVLSRLEHIVKS